MAVVTGSGWRTVLPCLEGLPVSGMVPLPASGRPGMAVEADERAGTAVLSAGTAAAPAPGYRRHPNGMEGKPGSAKRRCRDFCPKHRAGEDQLPLDFLWRSASSEIDSLTQSYITKNNSNIINCIIYGP